MTITVDHWLSFDEAKALNLPAAVHSMGGIDASLTRAQYLADFYPAAHPYIEAIWRALDDVGVISGAAHQEIRTPVFSDGTTGAFSMRAWGDLVAAWWNDRHPDALTNYCEFAWHDDVLTENERAERLRAHR